MMMEKRSFQQLSMHVLKGRWIVVVVSFYVLACSGATYIFGIYSGAIKKALHYDQETIDTLSFFKDLGANVGILAGLLNEVTPSWFVLAVGACLNVFGYLMIWLAVTHRIARPRVWQVYLYMCVGANSQTFANTGVLVTCVKNFPFSRGVVLGLLKGFVGLSGAIFTQIYHALYGQDTRGVILLVGWLPSLVSFMFMFFVRPMTPRKDKNEGKYFYAFLYLALLLASFLMIIIVVENQVNFSSATFKAMGTVTVLLVVANLWIGVRAELEKLRQQPADSKAKLQKSASRLPPSEDGNVKNHALVPHHECASQDAESKTLPTAPPLSPLSALSQQLISSAPSNGELHQLAKASEGETLEAESEDKKPAQSQPQIEPAPTSILHRETCANTLYHRSLSPFQYLRRCTLSKRLKTFYSNWPERGDDFTIPQALVSLDMWILFIATTCGVGATLTAIDNMGQIGESQGYSRVSISTFVSLISIWNFLGRVLAGFVSESLLKRYRFPRTLMLSIIIALACVGHLLIAFPAPGSLYTASIIVGLCFGAQWPMLYAVISELFGLKYYATLHTCGALASPLGSYLLNVRVAGYLYDREARRQLGQLLSSSPVLPAQAPATIPSSDLTCYGESCFRETFLIMTGVSLFGSLVSLILAARTKKFYSEDIYARFVNPEDEKTSEAVVSSQL